MSHDLVLAGCIPQVLAGYLEALGVHRLVAEQLDPEALSYWDSDGRFHLVSSADRDALVAFFVERYEPTPIVTPWNGGSGFYPGDQRAGIDAIAGMDDPGSAAAGTVTRDFGSPVAIETLRNIPGSSAPSALGMLALIWSMRLVASTLGLNDVRRPVNVRPGQASAVTSTA